MSNLSISTGLISGLDFDSLVKALALNQQRAIDKLDARSQEFEIKKTSIDVLEANLLALNSTVTALQGKVTFEQFSISNSADQQLRVSALKSAQPGNYVFQALQRASAHQSLSRGFANGDTQKVGQGTLTIAQGGFLDQPTLLEGLNDGSGVRRGLIRVQDRSGASAVIDLSRALHVDDVLARINENPDISVEARVVDGQFVLTDSSGGLGNLSVVDLNGGNTALDLGLRQSVASATLNGEVVYRVTENFNLAQLNDGNKIRTLQGAADMRISLADGSKVEVNLDGVTTLGEVLEKINTATGNNGKVNAALNEGRIVLTDNTSGGGALQVEDINQMTVVRQLGLDAQAAGDTLTGQRLSAGMNSVLLRNLRGGQGIEEQGEISLTDRTGRTATIDLSQAETLNEILEAINSATDDDTGEPLFLRATLNPQKNGIQISDTSGSTTGNLVIADLAGSTVAADLNIAIDAASSQVNSGNLSLRYVNEATSLEKYAPGGGAVELGMFRVVDSNGSVGVINLSSAVKNVGDVIQRINANTSISVRAELNETGDGFVLIDEAGGSGTLRVEELGEASTAADLRLLGEAYVDDQGQQRLSSRKVVQVQVDEDDTLEDLVEKLNDSGGLVTASIFNDGSTFNPMRLSVSSKESGRASRLMIDDGGLGLNFGTIVEARDARLQVGEDPATSFLLTSSTNSFKQVVQGIDIDIRNVGTTPANVDISPNVENVFERIQQFVTNYNQFVDVGAELTRFDPANNQRGVLQGDGIVLRATTRMNNLFFSRVGNSNEALQSLSALGIRVGDQGKLTLDEDRLRSMLNTQLSDVKKFFTAEETGFATRLKGTLESLTDQFDGLFALEKNVLSSSIDRTQVRVEQLTELMESRKRRLLNQFVAMENVIGSLQFQQNALGALKPMGAPPVKQQQ